MKYFDEDGNYLGNDYDDFYRDLPAPVSYQEDDDISQIRNPSPSPPPPIDISRMYDEVASSSRSELEHTIGDSLGSVGGTLSSVAEKLHPWSVVEATGVPRHVSNFLGWFDRPRAAIAGGVYGGQTEGAGGILPGLWRGLSGKQDISWGDVVGIPESQEGQPWYERAARTGSRLLMDNYLDPLNIFGVGGVNTKLGLAKAGRSLPSRMVQKLGGDTAKEWIAGSQLGKVGMHYLPDITVDGVSYRRAEDILNEAARKHNRADVDRTLDTVEQAVASAEKQLGRTLTNREKFEAIERWGHKRPLSPEDYGPEFDTWIKGNVPKEYQGVVEAFEPAREMKQAAREARIQRETELGIPPSKAISEEGINYMPQVVLRNDKGVLKDRPTFKLGDLTLDPGGPDRLSRDVFDWVNPRTGGIVARGKLDDPRTNIKEVPIGDERLYSHQLPGYGPEWVDRVQASRLEKEFAYPKVKFEDNPTEAIRTGTMRDKGALAFYDSVGAMRQEGIMKPVDPDVGVLPGYRQLDMPGIKDQVPKGLANYLENMYTTKIDPDYPLGAVGDLAKKLNESRIGQDLRDATTWWKRNVLGTFGWLTGNMGSNQGLIYEAGVPAAKIPLREAQAIKIQLKRGSDVLPGISNENLHEALLKRDAISGAQYGESARMPAGYGHRVRDFAETVPTDIGKKVTRGGAWLGEKYGKTNDAFFWLGGQVEDNARLAVAIHDLKVNKVNFNKLSQADAELALDRAAEKAKHAMIDYSKLTPTEAQFAKSGIPFFTWMRGIQGLTADYAMRSPQRLARMGRGLDALFEPMSPEQREVADDWIKESSPTFGIAGKKYGMDPETNDPLMWMVGRFNPQGDIERAVSRPGNYLLSSVNPLIKATAEVPSNTNIFTGRAIDPVTKGFPQNILGPLGGGDYQVAEQKLFGRGIPETWNYLLGASPGGRRLNELRQGSATAGLTREPYRTPASAGEYLTWLLTGGKSYPFDFQKYEQRRNLEGKNKVNAIKRGINRAAQMGDDDNLRYYQDMLMRHYNETSKSGVGKPGGL